MLMSAATTSKNTCTVCAGNNTLQAGIGHVMLVKLKIVHASAAVIVSDSDFNRIIKLMLAPNPVPLTTATAVRENCTTTGNTE
jgi:hypothetical protein